MEKPNQLRELFRMQQPLHPRIGVHTDSLAQVLSMGADDVFNACMKKNEVNFKRQESGYAQKDQEDSRHL